MARSSFSLRKFSLIFLCGIVLLLNIAVVSPVSAFEPPTINFTCNPESGFAPLLVQFTDQSYGGSLGVTSWNWNFGDGENSVLQHPSHTFNEPGVYLVTLRLNDDVFEYTKTITVQLYSGGNGTVDDPYLISRQGDLIYLSTHSGNWTEYFHMTENISLSDESSNPIGNMITKFTGTFDGQGYTISNYTINKNSEYVGLFGYLGENGVIKDLTVHAGADGVRGRANVGILVGYSEKGVIANCSSSGNATATLDYAAGGLVGYNNQGTITNCSSSGNATATILNAGGLVGVNNGLITNCSASGSATAINSDAGGLVGWNNGGTITDCSATGNATAEYDYAGGLVGQNQTNGSITNCSATGNAAATHNYAGGLVGYVDDGTITNCSATGNATAVNSAGGLFGYNDGTAENCNATGDVTATQDYAGGLVGWNAGVLTDCSATGSANANENAGGLVGTNYGPVTVCYATGTATVGNAQVGGLIGYNGHTVANCFATGNATAAGTYAGSLVGWNGGTVTNCYATGNACSGVCAGGLVGWNDDLLTNCYATGNATAQSQVAGGLVGTNSNFGNVTNCYATGTATATGGYAGGFVGTNYGPVTNCYATGTATATGGWAGGFVGDNTGTITNCYRNDTQGTDGALLTDLTKFRDRSFLINNTPNLGLAWSSDNISEQEDASKIWRVFPYKGKYPLFQWQSFDTGEIRISSLPSGASVFINGVATGNVTFAMFPGIPVGEYTVTVMMDGYGTQTQGPFTFTNEAIHLVYFNLIPVEDAPVTNFTATPLVGYAPLAVSFTDISTGSPTEWLWNFGDGQNATVQHPVHTYQNAGTYTVSLKATNIYGNMTAEKTGYIDVRYYSGGSDSDSGYTPRPAVVPTATPVTVQPTAEPTVTNPDEFIETAQLPVNPAGAAERGITIWADDMSGYLSIDAGVTARDA